MEKTLLFKELLSQLKSGIRLLPDKPEETPESTLKALWFKAFGTPISVKLVNHQPLPVLNEEQIKHLHKLINRRLEGTALAYITGRQNFMDVELLSDSRALIPRKETEILGNKALNLLQQCVDENGSAKLIDVGCGAGNLAVALACKIINVKIFASDISEDAINLTKENITLHNLSERIIVKQGDMLDPFIQDRQMIEADLIICNPPYIPTFKLNSMDKEISENEPEFAFNGGLTGMKLIQRLINDAPKCLRKGGWVIFEVGLGQGPHCIHLCEKSGLYEKVDSVTDDTQNIRVVLARK